MSSKNKKKLMIIDGNALIHRSFHALPPTMATKDGRVINAVFGFTSVLLKALKEIDPEYIVLTLDKKGKTFRHERYEDYKATRVKAPQELYDQIPMVKEVAQAFNIPIFEKEGFEADDLIGTITKKTDGEVQNIIVTGDMDTLQLVDEDTKVYTMSRGLSESVLYSEKEVKEKFGGLTPEQMIDYKALRGDPSDNIPGVRGIGDKTAIKLLNEFGDLDNLYSKVQSANNKVQIRDRIKNLLLEHKEEAYISKELATIKCDVKIDFDLEKAVTKDFDKNKVVELFSDFEFKSLLPRVSGLSDKVQDSSDKKQKDEGADSDKFFRNKKEFKYILVDDEKKFTSFLAKLKKQKAFTFDTETSGFNPLLSYLLGISFSWKEGEAYYVKIKNEELRIKNEQGTLFNYHKEEKTGLHPWLSELKPIFEDEKIKKSAHNIKFDMRVVQNAGMDIKGIYFDTMLASYLLNPGTRQHNLDALAFSELGWEKISKDDLLGTGRNKMTFSEVPDEKMYLYSCEDADFTNRLVNKLAKELKDKELDKLFYEVEMPLIPALCEMENTGIILDKKILDDLGKKVDKKIKALEKKIYDLSGEQFNINSPSQLKVILFEKLGISTAGIGKTKTGFSTAAAELEKLKNEHKIIPLIQDYRELSKLSTTYIHSLPELINPKTKRVHTSFNQTITATGRLSSTEPNLQNIPIRTELGAEIRKAFKADKGYKLVSLDYSQIELRLAAHLSGDKKMIEFFKNGEDIHAATAAAINNVKLEEVSKEMRREAKATNFGILYGQGPFGLSQTADIPFGQAKKFIEDYFEVFKDIKKYIDDSIEKARETGYAETMFGRKRFIPEIHSSVQQV
ncbi:DNA polymerase I, partial [Candidatus Falkowbacteria bacterium]|nr:DNA polymerase I [Candidatus Falkowbacteria bacterium]